MKEGTVKMVQLKEGGKVYTRTVGEGFPILLLHGGPGANHICFEIFEKYIDLKKFSLIYYDQLGSSHSDKITDESLLTFTRFVDEVEQVRAALGLERFILLGHSWGGMLCIDYALKYEKEGHLAGLVISNMVDSGKHYLEYLDHVRKINLTPEEYDYMTEIEAAGKESDAHYQELVEKLNCACLCRLEVQPDFLSLPNVPDKKVYHHFQGDNEFVVTGDMLYWDRSADMGDIHTRTLCIGARYDTMNPDIMLKMGEELRDGYTYICPDGSHLCFWDDSEHYFQALNEFIGTLDQ